MADANSGPHFPDFHRALTIWAESAVPLNNAQGLIEESRIRWVPSGENRRTSVYAPLLRWKRTDTANELTEWSTVVESASAEPIISRHLEGAVGTREYGAFPIDLRVFAEFCLA